DADYQTNAPSYYEDLARKEKLIQLLAEKIWEYDERLDERLEDLENVLQDYLNQWDERIENLDDEVSHIFITWLEDGTLEQIINHDILGNKANQADLDRTNERLAQSMQENRIYIDNQLKSLNGLELKGAYNTLQDLIDTYPNGTQGIFLIQETGHWYYWNGEWSDGGIYQALPWEEFMTINNEEWVI